MNISGEPNPLPDCLKAATAGYRWIKSDVGQSGASIYRLEKASSPALYLKCGSGKRADDITNEMVRLRWLAPFISVPEIRQFFRSDHQAWLLTAAMPGKSAYQNLIAHPNRQSAIVKAVAEFLKALHTLPADACPFNSDHEMRMAEARRNIDSGLVDESDFGSTHEGWTAEQVWTEMLALLPLSFQRVVTHGDFSLDNILVDSGRVAGCIDVGRAGLADPYQDLAILANNLEEFGEDLQAELFSAYGTEPDAAKIRFHLCLDEFF